MHIIELVTAIIGKPMQWVHGLRNSDIEYLVNEA